MATVDVTNDVFDPRGPRGNALDTDLRGASAISWGSIIAGAVAAASLSLILLILGTGLGLSSVSPWAQAGVSAAAFGVSTIVWITFTQLAASGLGGYLAGRLRTRWSAGTDEVYFRDTAHGFLAWGLSSLVTAALLTSVIGGIIGGGVQAGATAAGGVAAAGTAAVASLPTGQPATGDERNAGVMEPARYLVDTLFRKDAAATTPNAVTPDVARSSATEVLRIFAMSARSGVLPTDDQKYVAQLVAQQTGLSQEEAEKRVGNAHTRLQATIKTAEASARDAADKARKASAYGALWLFVSLLVGAFIASWTATLGGRQRDQ